MLISEKLKENQAFSKIFFAFEITAVDLLIFQKRRVCFIKTLRMKRLEYSSFQ